MRENYCMQIVAHILKFPLQEIYHANGYKILSVSVVQLILACNYIAPTGLKVVSASVQKVLACKYFAPTGIEIVSVVVQIVPAGKNLPQRLQI